MTRIDLEFARAASDGTLLPASGTMTWTPTRRHGAASKPGAVVLPLGFRTTVPSGPFFINVEPTSTDWVWKVEENFKGLRGRKFYVVVPDAVSVAYASLVEVDISTLEPTAAPAPAWVAMANSTVNGGSIVDGKLILNRTDGTSSDAGSVTGSATVRVATGDEARPDAPLVFWIGGTTQPSNMGLDDIWFQAPDTSAPTVPSGLAVTDLTQTTLTLSWTPSSDNSGVSNYDVFVNGVLKANTVPATAALTGLSASTSYQLTVRARDAAGNTSAQSEPLTVTTIAAAGTPRHSVWGNAAYPYTVTKYTESTPITVGNAFYSYGTTPDVSAWRIRGAKIWVPAGVTLTQSAVVSVWAGETADFATTPAAQGTISEWVAGAWNEVIFNTPIETNAAEVFFIGYRTSNGDYLAASGGEIGSGFVTATDGSHIVLAEDTFRSRYRYDGDVTALAPPSGYSIDAIWDEGPA